MTSRNRFQPMTCHSEHVLVVFVLRVVTEPTQGVLIKLVYVQRLYESVHERTRQT